MPAEPPPFGRAIPAAGSLSIGELAAATAVSVRNIRYYEAAGLLPSPPRTAGNQRAYGEAHLRRLGFVRHARELGFPLESVRDLLRLADAAPDAPCADADRIARRQLAEIAARISRLRSLQAELERVVQAGCDGTVADCRVIGFLHDGEHEHCLDPTHGRDAA